MKLIGIFVRLIAGILFILTIPLVPFQLLYFGIMFVLTGDTHFTDPIPFLIVDKITDWWEEKESQ